MKIILTTLNAKYIHSSLALRYLKAYSEKDFPEMEIMEFSIKEPIMNILSDLYNKAPDVIGFSCYIWNIEETIEIVRLLKKVKPNIKVILGGPEVSYDLDYWFKRVKEIDYIVIGEGEETLNHLLKTIKESRPINEVLGIAYRENEHYQVTKARSALTLDDVPTPYKADDLATLKDKIVYFEASRGCPFSCAYCLSSIDTGVRYFSLERVKEDLLRIIQSGVKTIKFVDRTFNIHKKYAMEIFQFLIDHHQGTIFQFEITADIMKDDVIQFLVDNAPANIFRFEIGIQSTNEYTNSLINRRQNFERIKNTVLKFKESKKVDQHLDLIAGLPEEDYTSFRKTFNDVFALRPEELQLGFLKMLRGTPIWLEAKKYDYVYMDKAPYEILQNHVMSFDDVIRIKQVEDILEKYWNDHRMDYTINYLIDNEFSSPFDFFQEFGTFWHSQGWNRIGHQLEALFERLQDFLKTKKEINFEFVTSLMKLDYFLNFKHKPRKTWWDFSLTKSEQTTYMKELVNQPAMISGDFAALELKETNIHKHVMIEKVPYDIASYQANGEVKLGDTLLIVYYNPPNSPKFYLAN